MALGPQSGQFEGSIDRLVVMKAGGDGEFKGTFTVKATRGDIVIKNQGYTEVQIPTCVPMAGNGTVGADGAVMTFMFRTDYETTLPREHGHGHHVCGKATINGKFGWRSQARPIKRHFSETINSEGRCPNPAE
jgi:hypothetical protein